MENNKELELLREYFSIELEQYDEEAYICDDCFSKQLELRKKIQEIQKQNKLRRKIMYIQNCLSVGDEKEFMEILKELGYKC